MRLNIGVIFGGKSVEHEVSIISALQMMENMNGLKYQAIPIYLSKENEFYYHENFTDINLFKDLNKVKKTAEKVVIQKNGDKVELIAFNKNKFKVLYELDVLFLVVHGTGCEDGTLAAYCELLDIPYVGSSLLPSGINQNKWIMKQLLCQNEIPNVPFYGFYESDFYCDEEQVMSYCEKLGYPLVVKPATLGSSVGITKCHNKDELHQSILDALQYDNQIIVEKEIEHLIEYNCSVLGDLREYQASCVERVFQEDEILSYQDKYIRGNKKSSGGMVNTKRECPAKISNDLKTQIQQMAIKAVKTIAASGVLRIDFLYNEDSEELYLNEINTIPGSLAFYLWEAKGLSYKELIDQLIEISLHEYQVRSSKIFSYDSNLLSLPIHFKGKS